MTNRHGWPIARNVPEASQRQQEIDDAIDSITESTKKTEMTGQKFL